MAAMLRRQLVIIREPILVILNALSTCGRLVKRG